MVSYKPTTIDLQKATNPLQFAGALAIEAIDAFQSKKAALCGAMNSSGTICGMPISFSKDKSQRDVVCGFCGSEINWEDFITYVNYCPECHEEKYSSLPFCTRHSPAVRLEKKEKST